MNKPQLILAVKRSQALALATHFGDWNGLTSLSFEDMLQVLQASGLYLGPREQLEEDPQFLQIIPYIVLKQGDKYVKYTRTDKGGESELHGKVSIGAGGHIDFIDVVRNMDSTINLHNTLKLSTIREVDEEFGLPETWPQETWLGILHDFTDKVGNVHLGVVSVWDMPSGFEFQSREASQTDVKLATLEELLADEPRMEKWSAHVLHYLNITQGL